MKILQFFYENPPQNKENFARKVALPKNTRKNLLIKGAKNSGKKSLILDFLSEFKSEEFLFLDFEDLRFNESCLVNLTKFAQEKQLKTLILYNTPKSLNLSTFLKKIPKNTQIIISTQFKSINLVNFKEISVDFLDFEEFISLSKTPTNAQVGAFLQHGRGFNLNINSYLRANFSALELEILKFIARNLGEEFSVNELFLELKKSLKVSKDSLYKAVNDLEDMGILCFLWHHSKRLKKAFFRDFVLKNALCIDKDFNKIFTNLVFTELLKLKDELRYDKSFDFYLKKAKSAIIPSAVLDVDLIKLKALKIIPKALELGISKLIFITLSNENSFHKDGVKVEITPFESWALSL